MAPIPSGSTVLVTGANGFIGSHIVDQLLQKGYKVRGTVRSEGKGKWVQEYFDNKYGSGKLELVVVPDMAAPGAFNDAVKGVSGVAHVASNLSFSDNPNDVIPSVLSGIDNTLRAAMTEPSIKRFVFTSSSTAATNPKPNEKFDIKEDSWNTETVEEAWKPAPYDGRKWVVYGASKTQAEQELWKFAKENKPSFEVNAVLPNANFGPIINEKEQDASTAGWIRTIYRKGIDDMKFIPPQWFVNVQDTARLHVSALINPDVKDERIFGFSAPYNWNDILAILRKLKGDDPKWSPIEDDSRDLSNPLPRTRAEELLKDFGRSGWIGLEDSVKDLLASLD